MPAAVGLQLVTGPARSGKSRWAEHLAAGHGGRVTYVATAALRPHDPSWQERLQRHRRRRPAEWELVECEERLPEALEEQAPDQLLLVDALGTWVVWTLEESEPAWRQRSDRLIEALQGAAGPLILVSEQTGWGVVPPTAIGGLFRDRLGLLEQEVAALCNRVWLVAAGRALDLAYLGQPVPD